MVAVAWLVLEDPEREPRMVYATGIYYATLASFRIRRRRSRLGSKHRIRLICYTASDYTPLPVVNVCYGPVRPSKQEKAPTSLSVCRYAPRVLLTERNMDAYESFNETHFATRRRRENLTAVACSPCRHSKLKVSYLVSARMLVCIRKHKLTR
jgi:hypothetical protein